MLLVLVELSHKLPSQQPNKAVLAQQTLDEAQEHKRLAQRHRRMAQQKMEELRIICETYGLDFLVVKKGHSRNDDRAK